MSTKQDNMGVSYGKALFDLVVERNKSEALTTLSELETVSLWVGSELGDFIQNPTFEKEEKKAVFKTLAEKSSLSDMVIRFVGVLIDQGQFNLISKIVVAFSDALMEKENRVKADVYVPRAITDDAKAKITKVLSEKTKKEVVLDVHLDPSLIGGVRAQIGSIVYDASIAGQLKRLSEEV